MKVVYPNLEQMVAELKEKGIKEVRVSALTSTSATKVGTTHMVCSVLVTAEVGGKIGECRIRAVEFDYSMAEVSGKPDERRRKADEVLREAKEKLEPHFTVRPGILAEEKAEVFGGI